jgi:hypothetical protein
MACWQTANGESGPVPVDMSVDGSAIPNQQPPEQPSAATANSEPPKGDQFGTQKNIRCPKCGTLVNARKGGAPTKATDELLAAILSDMTEYGMTEAQACARHGVRAETFSRWKNLPEHEGLRAEAEAIWIKTKLDRKRELADNKLDWKEPAWDLERRFKSQFGDPNKAPTLQINQQFNNGNISPNQGELEDARKRLDETKRLQQNRKAGVATNAELRETMIRQIEECQHVVDCIDRGEIPSQEDQQKLYRLHEEGGDRDEEPIREAIGHVVDGKPLALEDQGGLKPAPEQELESRPKRPAPQDHSMRASDMDLSSGQRKRRSDNSGDSQESQAPPEPHVRQQDRKPPVGPLSERQRQRLEQEKARRGGEGKNPFG